MSEREWKPGDVALLDCGTESERVGLRDVRNEGWRTPHGYMSDETTARDAVIRPLVVIDPEDWGVVEQLGEAFVAGWGGCGGGVPGAMHTALNCLLLPPKPDEPTGLGAVVKDTQGRLWTRYDTKGDGQPWWCDDVGPEVPVERRYPYADIAAIRVLSEGVTP